MMNYNDKNSGVKSDCQTSKHHFFNIDGINIGFPHEPYQVQIDYISKLLECLRKRQNGLLESPTGTGKTLSLLCGALAWLEHHQAFQQISLMGLENGPNSQERADVYFKSLSSQIGKSVGNSDSFDLAPTKVIYTSRTHSQLSQVVQELKKTNYNHMPAVVLGSRDQMCLLPEVASLESNAAKLHACRAKVKSRTCPFYLNTEQKVATEPDFKQPGVLDIEDLVKLGRKHRCCPYYSAKEANRKANVIFAPYNYLIDPKTRKSQSIKLANSVLIFDEAHNIENICEDSMSFQVKSKDIACSISEVSKLLEKFANFNKPDAMDYGSPSDIDMNISIDDLASLKVMLTEIEKVLDELSAQATPEKGIIKNGGYIYEILRKAGLNESTAPNVQMVLEEVISNLNDSQSFGGTKNAGLIKFSEMLEHVFSYQKRDAKSVSMNKPNKFDQHYKLCISDESKQNKYKKHDYWDPAKSTSSKKNWVLDCWCLSPERSMCDLISQGIHCMILTSGTLSPLKSFEAELGITFPVQLENPHIIKPEQFLVAVVNKGPDGINLTSSYGNRDNPAYVKSLGMAMNNFCTSVPKGVLVFFPSYTLMNNCIDKWRASPLLSSLTAKKAIFIEPRSKDAFSDCMEQYSANIDDEKSKGAVLFGVCRGKISEGLDFANDHARAVVITGIPFAPFFDERVKLKKQYLTENKQKGLSGEEWYLLQAIRAVNQAIGRVIRHKNDFGVVLLCDNRFGRQEYVNQLSKWVRGSVKNFNSFGMLQKSLCDFFKYHRGQQQDHSVTASNGLECAVSTSQISVRTKVSNFTKIQNRSDDKSHDLIKMYGTPPGNSESKSKPKKTSIFDEIAVDERYSKPGLSSIDQFKLKRNEVSEDINDQKFTKKRKIALAPVNIFGNKSDSTKPKMISEEEKEKLLEEKRASIKKFTQKVKEFHGKEGQLRLQTSIKEAISKHDVDIFVKELINLTTTMKDKKEIFNSVIVLLPTGMRKAYLDAVKDFPFEEAHANVIETSSAASVLKEDYQKTKINNFVRECVANSDN